MKTQLIHCPVPISSTAEDLNRPIDKNIQITSNFPWHKIEFMVDGEAVSKLVVVDFKQQIGSLVVRMGGIGGVETRKEHRRKGYSRKLMENSLCWMRQNGFDTTLLYGIKKFYPKFGYAPAFPEIIFTIPVRDAERVRPSGYSFKMFAPQYIKPVLAMYHKNNTGRTGPTRRDPKFWKYFKQGASWGRKAVCKVGMDKHGRLAGYFVYDEENLDAIVTETGFTTPRVFPDILRAAARVALKQRLEYITFFLPQDDAFMEFCKPLGVIKKVNYARDGGGMVRMINIPEALRKVSSEFSKRMRGKGRLNICTNLDDVGLSWSKGSVSVHKGTIKEALSARMPQWALAQLLYGYRSASGLENAGVLKVSKQAVSILEEMFPLTVHYHYRADHF